MSTNGEIGNMVGALTFGFHLLAPRYPDFFKFIVSDA